MVRGMGRTEAQALGRRVLEGPTLDQQSHARRMAGWACHSHQQMRVDQATGKEKRASPPSDRRDASELCVLCRAWPANHSLCLYTRRLFKPCTSLLRLGNRLSMATSSFACSPGKSCSETVGMIPGWKMSLLLGRPGRRQNQGKRRPSRERSARAVRS